MLNDTKKAVDELLREAEKASRHWRRCLLVEIKGEGRFDEHAARSAYHDWLSATEVVREAMSDTVAPTGLLAADSDIESVTLAAGGRQVALRSKAG